MNSEFPPLETELADARAATMRGASVLDVREAREWAEGVCPGAVCLALSEGIAPMTSVKSVAR